MRYREALHVHDDGGDESSTLPSRCSISSIYWHPDLPGGYFTRENKVVSAVPGANKSGNRSALRHVEYLSVQDPKLNGQSSKGKSRSNGKT